MKKLLLTLAAALTLGMAANAATTTITCSEQYASTTTGSTDLDGTSITSGDITIAFAKGTGSNSVQYYANGTNIRMYAGNTMTITSSGENITSFTITSSGSSYDLSKGTTLDGTINGNTWTGDASTVTITGGTIRFTDITITTGTGSGTETPGPGTDPEDPETPDQPDQPGDDTSDEVVQAFDKNIGFANASGDAPTTATTVTATNTNITYTVLGCYANTGYLMIPGKTTKGSYISWSLNFDLATLKLTTSSGCSTNAASKVNIYANGELIEEGYAVNFQNKTYEVEIPEQYRAAGTVYKVESASTSYNQQFASFTYVKYVNTGKEAPGLAFSVTNVSATLGSEVTVPTLTKSTDAEATYSSSAVEVATVEATTGAVTLVGIGKTTITASVAETETYDAGKASYELSVSPAEGTVLTVAQAMAGIKNEFSGEATVKGIISAITDFNTQYKNATYTIVDELNTNQAPLTVYRGKGLNGADFTEEGQIAVGATVVVKGELLNYSGTYEFTTGSEILEYTAPEGGEDPTPGPGEDTDYITATFNFAEPTSLTPAQTPDEKNSAIIFKDEDMTFTAGEISVSTSYEEGATSYPQLFYSTAASNGGWGLRFYQYSTITISAANGYLIKSIEFTAQNLNNNSIVWSENGSFSNNVFTATAEAGVQTITINKTATGNNPAIQKMTVKYDKDAGVAAIENEDAPIEWFNLQGVRVVNPENGLYIRRQGNSVSKVLVK